MTSATDESLVSAAQRGDPEALEALVRRYQSRVYRFGLRMCGDPADAEDVLQETLLAMVKSMHGYRHEASVSTWLYSIARSFCLKRRRRGKFAPRRDHAVDINDDASTIADPSHGPEEQAAGRQIEQVLAAAIAALPGTYREVLVLRDLEGLSLANIATVLDLRVEAVKSRLHRARLALRETLAPALGLETAPGPDCPDVLTTLSRHLEGEITPDVCAAMERHLAHCRQCRSACDSLKQTLTLCRNAPTPRVPAAVQNSIRENLQRLLHPKSTDPATARPLLKG